MRQKVTVGAYRRLNTIIQKVNMLACILSEGNNTTATNEIEEIKYKLLAIHNNWIATDKELMQESIDRKNRYKGDTKE